jgi:hypothetical protein
MTSVVYFKFKNAIAQEQVTFDGSVIQIGDVKRLVALKRGLGAEGAAELTLFDPNTNEEYGDDAKVIPRNSLVLVKRAPATKLKPLQSSVAAQSVPTQPEAAVSGAPTGQVEVGSAVIQEGAEPGGAGPGGDDFGDYYSEQPTAALVGEDEDKALASLLQGTAATWQREVRQGAMRGRGRGRGRGGVAPDYRCPRCVGMFTSF